MCWTNASSGQYSDNNNNSNISKSGDFNGFFYDDVARLWHDDDDGVSNAVYQIHPNAKASSKAVTAAAAAAMRAEEAAVIQLDK